MIQQQVLLIHFYLKKKRIKSSFFWNEWSISPEGMTFQFMPQNVHLCIYLDIIGDHLHSHLSLVKESLRIG